MLRSRRANRVSDQVTQEREGADRDAAAPSPDGSAPAGPLAAVSRSQKAVVLYQAHRQKLWALGDQVMVSAVNFLTMAIVARVLGVEQFGLFFWSYVVFLLLKAMHQALIVAPMMSIGPKKAPHERPTYYASVVLHQLALVALTVIVVPLVLEAFVLADPQIDLRALTWALIAASIGDQVQDSVRRYMFTHGRVIAAFANDVIAYLARLGLFYGLYFFTEVRIDGEMAYWLMALTSLSAAAIGFFWFETLKFERIAIEANTRHHWTFSKWLFGMGVLQFCSGHAMTLVGALVIGQAAYGGIRATYNILAPIQVFTLALQNVAPVRASELYKAEGTQPLVGYLVKLALAGIVFSAVIGLLGWLFAEDFVRLLYGEEFVPYAGLINWWVLIFAIRWLQFPLEVGLRAIEYTQPLFISVVIEAVFGLSAAYFIASWYGLNGVMAGLVMAHIIPVTVLTVCFLRRIGWRRPENASHTTA